MEKKKIAVIFCLLCVESLAIVHCKYPKVLVRLQRNENHSVPICPSIWHGKFESKQLEQNVVTCDGLLCNRCRCDVNMGYMLSNNTSQAECVLTCPNIL